MSRHTLRNGANDLRERLLEVLRRSCVDCGDEFKEDISLIKSGALDSLGLFNVALFVEREAGSAVDLTAYDLAREWDTVADIVDFIVRLRLST